MTNEAQNLSREMILPAYKAACLSYHPSTNVERPLQIRPFMRNKANFKIGKIKCKFSTKTLRKSNFLIFQGEFSKILMLYEENSVF